MIWSELVSSLEVFLWWNDSNFFPSLSLSFPLSAGPPVNVTCNIFINSFGSIAETTMVSAIILLSLCNTARRVDFDVIYLSLVCVCVWMIWQLMENVTSHRGSIPTWVISPWKMRLIEMTVAAAAAAALMFKFHFYFLFFKNEKPSALWVFRKVSASLSLSPISNTSFERAHHRRRGHLHNNAVAALLSRLLGTDGRGGEGGALGGEFALIHYTENPLVLI